MEARFSRCAVSHSAWPGDRTGTLGRKFRVFSINDWVDYRRSGLRSRFCPKRKWQTYGQLASFMLDYADWLSTHVEDLDRH